MNYKIGKEDNESGLKEVVVSHKCGQAILQGAHVCSKHSRFCIAHTFFLSHNHNYSQNIGSLKRVDGLWWIFQLFVLGVLICNEHVEKVEMVVVLEA